MTCVDLKKRYVKTKIKNGDDVEKAANPFLLSLPKTDGKKKLQKIYILQQ